MAGNGRPPGNSAAVQPSVHPPGTPVMPRSVTPLGAGSPSSTSMGGTGPSTAPDCAKHSDGRPQRHLDYRLRCNVH